jgi:hypothetical protein
MARWVAVELEGGKTLEGKQVVSAANLLERRKPMVRAGEKVSYGLALLVEKYDGIDIVSHNGGTLGFNTLAAFLPEHGVGLVVLTNTTGAGSFLNAARRRRVELLFAGKDEAKQNLDFSLKRRDDAMASEYGKVDKTPTKEWLANLAGTYENPALGKVSLRWENDRAILDAGDWKVPVGRLKEEDGNEKLVPLDPPRVGFDFLVKGGGEATTLTLDVGQEKYVFTRARR